MLQDKLVQKRHFQSAGVPVAAFLGIDDAAAAQAAAQAFGFPFMLKARRSVKAIVSLVLQCIQRIFSAAVMSSGHRL